MADYKGGYQIIDLSGDNIYAKAKSAFETNKPVLVYDGGIGSFGNVTKDSTNFVINYTIDDKLYQATVAADNTVTKTSTEIGGGGEPVSDVVVIDCSNNSTIHLGYEGQEDVSFFTSDQISAILSALSSNKRVILHSVVIDSYLDFSGQHDLTLLNISYNEEAESLYANALVSGATSSYALFFKDNMCISVKLSDDRVGSIILDETNSLNLDSYIASDDLWFIVPSDGYITIDMQASVTTGETELIAKSNVPEGSSRYGITMLKVKGDSTAHSDIMFVKKGMNVALAAAISTGVTCKYFPLIYNN